MSIAVALGDTGGALRLRDTIRLDDTVPLATRARYGLDVALTHVECRRWDQAADTLEKVCGMAPGWVRHQMLPGVIISPRRRVRRAAPRARPRSRYTLAVR